ncbi:DJ-1/PfpI family protein [Austwickia sp. TVS 96-490-7B]|uniref:DJ-1/PfpI family protein n=1 Tax=Austwickia sp. TVS 96-490-7B TaxID=2830843 RepID=UPI001C584C9C|nr:DJ-1/PfpI family protein [Austwickia sp. TVS 96-490-7B]
MDGRAGSHPYADLSLLLEHTESVADVSAADCDLLYLASGHGAMVDFVADDHIARLIREVTQAGRPVAAVGHGVAGLLATRNGERPVVASRKITSFSTSEERLVHMADNLPYSLPDALARAGARYRPAPVPFLPYVVRDGMIVTGANPSSASRVLRTAWQLVPTS